jgi:hypothetical protein
MSTDIIIEIDKELGDELVRLGFASRDPDDPENLAATPKGEQAIHDYLDGKTFERATLSDLAGS